MPTRVSIISPCLIDNVDEKIMSEACAKQCIYLLLPCGSYHLGFAPMMWVCYGFGRRGVSIIITTSAKKIFPPKPSRRQFPAAGVSRHLRYHTYPNLSTYPPHLIYHSVRSTGSTSDHDRRRRRYLEYSYHRSTAADIEGHHQTKPCKGVCHTAQSSRSL